jgi:hypothetical protein
MDNNCTLEAEMNRLIFKASGRYRLDLSLPHAVLIDEIGAQFDRSTRELTVTMTAAH